MLGVANFRLLAVAYCSVSRGVLLFYFVFCFVLFCFDSWGIVVLKMLDYISKTLIVSCMVAYRGLLLRNVIYF